MQNLLQDLHLSCAFIIVVTYSIAEGHQSEPVTMKMQSSLPGSCYRAGGAEQIDI